MLLSNFILFVIVFSSLKNLFFFGVYVQTAERDASLARRVLFPSSFTFSLLFFFGRFNFAKAAFDLFSLWLRCWKSCGVQTPQEVMEGRKILEAAVRVTAAAGKKIHFKKP